MSNFAHWMIAAACVGSQPDFHVQPYLQQPERDAITIKWETIDAAAGTVHYGPTPEATLRVDEPGPRRVHEVRLTRLLPRTRYFYRVHCGDSVSPLHSFRTPPGRGEPWRLAVYGDSRSYPDRHGTVAKLIAGFEPDLVLHTGDQVTRGTVREQWKREFFDPLDPLAARVPVVTSLGNHERSADHYFEYFTLPGNERYFSFDFASAHVVVLDSNSWGKDAAASDQADWLKEDLAARRPDQWTLVVFHHPLFSAHDTRPINPARWAWCSLFEELGVDLVLTGHDHFYYRSWPIGRLRDTPSAGVVHTTTGGGGAPLYNTKERSYVAVNRSVHHCLVLDFDGDTVHGRAVDVEGNTLDTFRRTLAPTSAAEFCAYEVYELERAIEQAVRRLVSAASDGGREIAVNESIELPHSFAVPVTARLMWLCDGDGSQPELLRIDPGRPLVLPVAIRLAADRADDSLRVRIELLDDRFRNRVIELTPLKE